MISDLDIANAVLGSYEYGGKPYPWARLWQCVADGEVYVGLKRIDHVDWSCSAARPWSMIRSAPSARTAQITGGLIPNTSTTLCAADNGSMGVRQICLADRHPPCLSPLRFLPMIPPSNA